MVTASNGHYGQRAARNGPDSICRIQLPTSVSVPFFQRKHGSYCAKPTRIRSGWFDEDLVKYISSGIKPVCRNHRALFLAERNRFRFFTEVPDNIVQNQPGSDLVLADCASFGSNGFGPKASQCARITQPASGHSFPADPDRK